MSHDPELDGIIRALYSDMLRGDPSKQAEIDSYIYAELVLRDAETAERLRACSPNVPELLRSTRASGIHCDTLPDLGNFIRSVVFFSGDNPSEAHAPNTPICCCIYEALPNIKRTKQVKHKLNREKIQEETQNISAMVCVMLGTLLALYPGRAKAPSFKTRCDIVGVIRGIQCIPLQEKVEFLGRIPNLLRICFMEYVSWFIHAYMPVELQIIEKSPTTKMFLQTCPIVCDMLRQEMIKLDTLDFAHLDRLATQAIERCVRLCKFKMQRHVYTKESLLNFPMEINKESFQRALALLSLNRNCNTTKRHKGRPSAPLDTTKELHIFYPSETDHVSITYASILHQYFRVLPLPSNIAEEQLAALRGLYSHCSMLQNAARYLHVCATCIMQGRTQTPRFRLSLATHKLQCNACKNDYSVLKIDLVGSVVYLAGKAIVMCPRCTRSTMNHGDGSVLMGACRGCEDTGQTVLDTARGRKECARCQSTSIVGTLRLLNSEHMRIEDVPLCGKHLPTSAAQRYIHDISQL